MRSQKGLARMKIFQRTIQNRIFPIIGINKTDSPLHQKKFSGGFTLIELLVVIAIISLLSTVIMAALGTSRMKARDSRRVQDIRQLQTALALYFDDNKSYPDALSDLVPNHIKVLPVPPSGTTQSSYAYARFGAFPGVTYYHLGATLEDSATVSKLPSRNCRSGTLGTAPQCVTGQNATAGGFNGTRVDCTNAANSSPVFCYDVTP